MAYDLPWLNMDFAMFSSISMIILHIYVILQETDFKSFQYEDIELDNKVLCFDTPN